MIRAKPSIMLIITVPPQESSGIGTPTTGARPITIAPFMSTQTAEVAVGDRGDAQRHEDHRRIEQQDGDAADEAELLGQRGEHEVGLLLGQEVERALGAGAKALPQEPSR